MTKFSLTAWALRRPVTITMLFIAMLLLGAVASKLLPLEMWPGLDIPQITVQVPYQGSSPREVEREITSVLEESLATLGGVKKMRSGSNQDEAWVRMDFAWEEDIGNRVVEVRERIDSVRHLLPDDVERLLIWQFATSDAPIMTLRLSSQRDLSAAFDLLDKQLKRPLARLDGISRVELYGVEPMQIHIRLSPEKMLARGVNQHWLSSQLQQQNFVLTAGTVRTGEQLWQVSQQGEFNSLASIEQLMIRKDLLLGDIAEISFSQPEPEEGRHLNRAYAVGLDLFKESGANLVEVAERVRPVLERAQQSPQFDGIELFVMDDQAKGVKNSLNDLAQAGGIGALLSFAVLFLFIRNPLTTAIIVISVPLSIAITLGLMYLLGYSLNILSMMGLLLAVGMLIDNAVVVSESVLQQPPENRRQAVISGVDNVGLAVLAGTLTTAIVFIPNIFGVKVELTVFLEHVAIAICFSLLASLLISRSLLPLLLFKFCHFGQSAQQLESTRYRRLLSWTLSHPKTSGAMAIIILASTALPVSKVNNGDDEDGQDRLYINYQLEGRHQLEFSEAMINRMEDYLYQHQQEYGFHSIYSYYATDDIQTTLLLNDELPLPLPELKQKIAAGFPKYAFAEPVFGWQDNDNNGMRVHLRGRSTETLLELAAEVVPLLSSIDGLSDVRSDLSGGQQELLIRFDRQRLAQLELSLQQSAATVATALRGENLRSYRHDVNGEIEIRLQWPKRWQQSRAKLSQLPLGKVNGTVVTLQQVATISEQPRLNEIRHFNRQTSIAIGGNINDRDFNDLKQEIEQRLQSIAWPEGYGYSFGGGFEYQDESQALMATNMLLAVVMIYIVMAALFESLLLPTAVISSILFAITGVFWTFFITAQSMSIMAMIGILVLMGIVVNNGIVLVDQINQRKPQLETLQQAIIDAAVGRLRPVLMTVATTILGLLPLALGDTRIAGGGPSYTPMAIAIIGGLIVSTATSLLLVPYLYLILSRWRNRCAQGVSAIWQRQQQQVPNRLK
ncbi:efflux RND transporter permease subunit [Ferrimonas lipolytica]|uniref:Efflux RND transporter permease subunit n=1 Tax=Ferrimonas lipolytica TaxID=2724191 RepID=A0A6H1UAD4_9GAMM|nr:efflux RND transporter permease subunit [Ferrimonas lipolytica]QIZ75994.1 efflux RND transporter permease subunit [Ferrimonas lipolytica]